MQLAVIKEPASTQPYTPPQTLEDVNHSSAVRRPSEQHEGLCSRVTCRVLVLMITLFMAACSPKDNSAPQSTEELNSRLRLTLNSSPQTLDPHQIVGMPGYKVVAAISEPLVTLDFNTFEVGPGVAERWQQSDNGLVYQFFLRESARWSNGDRITASDFVNSFKRIFSPSLGNQYASEFFAIRSSQVYYAGEETDFKRVGVEALTPDILQITLVRPDPLFLRRLGVVNCAPVHTKSVLQYGALDDPSNPWQQPGNFISNGPFYLSDWQLNERILVKKNPFYWDAASVKLDEIEFLLTESEAIEERMFRAGQVDMTFGGRISAEKLETYRRESPELLKTKTVYSTYFYMFNTSKAPFDDVLVRRALALSIDRQLLVDSILKNNEDPAHSVSLPAGGYVPPSVALKYNPAEARRLLAEAGFQNGQGFPKFTILYNTQDAHRKIAVAIQQMWKEVLNIDAELENQEWKVFLATRKGLHYDVARGGVFSTLGDPVDLLQSYASGHPMNYTGWSNPQYNNLIERSHMQQKQSERYQLLYEAEKILLSELPILPIYFYKNSYLISPRVKGFKLNMADVPNYKGVYLEAATDLR